MPSTDSQGLFSKPPCSVTGHFGARSHAEGRIYSRRYGCEVSSPERRAIRRNAHGRGSLMESADPAVTGRRQLSTAMYADFNFCLAGLCD